MKDEVNKKKERRQDIVAPNGLAFDPDHKEGNYKIQDRRGSDDPNQSKLTKTTMDGLAASSVTTQPTPETPGISKVTTTNPTKSPLRGLESHLAPCPTKKYNSNDQNQSLIKKRVAPLQGLAAQPPPSSQVPGISLMTANVTKSQNRGLASHLDLHKKHNNNDQVAPLQGLAAQPPPSSQVPGIALMTTNLTCRHVLIVCALLGVFLVPISVWLVTIRQRQIHEDPHIRVVQAFRQELLETKQWVTPPELLDDPNTIQSRAFRYVVEQHVLEPEFYLVATLAYSLMGDGTRKEEESSWPTFLLESDKEHWCDWSWLECNTKRRLLSKVRLDSQKLQGTIPSDIQHFTALRHLELTRNDFQGTLPLVLGTLTHLEYLDLSDNDFTGHIPDNLWTLHNLRVLDLHDNVDLRGTLPATIDMPNLDILNLANCNVSGSIPTEIGRLGNLTAIYLLMNEQ